MDSFLTTLDEYVDDENKIVTCKWLSRQLLLHVNQARRIIEAYAKGKKKKDNDINIVYTLIGRGSNGMCVKVVRDSELDSAKSQLKQVISVSVYSVQKSKLKDSSMLYAADYDGSRENLHENSRFGGITYSGAERLSKEELKRQTSKSVANAGEASASGNKKTVKLEKSKTPEQRTNFFKKTSPHVEKNIHKDVPVTVKQEVQKPPEVKAPEKPKPKKVTGVAAFMTARKKDPFASSKVKMKPAVEEKSEESIKKPSTKTTKETKKKEKTNGKVSRTENESEDEDFRIDDFPLDEDFQTETELKKKPKEEIKKGKGSEEEKTDKKLSTNSTTKSKKNPRKDSNDLPAKKRRRIQEMSSSSEDDEEEEEEMLIPPSPPPAIEPEVIEASPEEEQIEKNLSNGKKNQRMKKVLKSKTYGGADGSMVTEKEYVLEPCESDDDISAVNGAAAPKANELETKQKKFPLTSTAQQKKRTKQAQITGFLRTK